MGCLGGDGLEIVYKFPLQSFLQHIVISFIVKLARCGGNRKKNSQGGVGECMGGDNLEVSLSSKLQQLNKPTRILE